MITPKDKLILKHIETMNAASIKQIAKLFYQKNVYSYDQARKRLKIMLDGGLLKQYTNIYTNERVFYMNKRLSPHDMFILDYYTEVAFSGAEILEFKIKPRYDFKDSYIEPDAYIKFSFGEYIYFQFLEVNLTHKSDLKRYIEFKNTGLMQKECQGEFPCIIVMDEDGDYFSSKELNLVYLNLALDGFAKVFS